MQFFQFFSIIAYRTSYNIVTYTHEYVPTDVHTNSKNKKIETVCCCIETNKTHNRLYHKSTHKFTVEVYTIWLYVVPVKDLTLVINIYFCPCLAKATIYVRKSSNCFQTKHFIFKKNTYLDWTYSKIDRNILFIQFDANKWR